MFGSVRKLLRLDLPLLPVMISTFAILLSQFPPLYSMFSKPSISIELGLTAQVNDNWGAMVFEPYLLLQNSGDVAGLVEYAEIVILRPKTSKQIGMLPVKTYYGNVSGDSPAPMIPVRLIRVEPGHVWANYVSAWAVQSDTRQDVISSIVNAARVDYDKNFKQGTPWLMPSGILREALDVTLDEKVKISEGKYYAFVSAYGEGGAVLDSKIYTFSLRKIHLKPLYDKLKEYEYGAGIIFSFRTHKPYSATVDVSPVVDDEVADELYAQYLSGKDSVSFEEYLLGESDEETESTESSESSESSESTVGLGIY